MAKKRRKKSSSKCPEPLNTLIDIAGAITMGAVAKSMVKHDYERGKGQEAIEAATMVYGLAALRGKSERVMALGGLHGVNSAIQEILKSEQAKRQYASTFDEKAEFSSGQTNDNQYAWRLNCEDGSEYGIYPEDYETREEYNEALQEAREEYEETDVSQYSEQSQEVNEHQNEPTRAKSAEKSLLCQVSLLSNGRTEYFRTNDQTIKIGEIVEVTDGDSTATGVVVSADVWSSGEFPQTLGQITGRIHHE